MNQGTRWVLLMQKTAIENLMLGHLQVFLTAGWAAGCLGDYLSPTETIFSSGKPLAQPAFFPINPVASIWSIGFVSEHLQYLMRRWRSPGFESGILLRPRQIMPISRRVATWNDTVLLSGASEGRRSLKKKIITMAPATDDQVSRVWAPSSLLSYDLFPSILTKSRYGSQRRIHPRTMRASFGPCKDPCWLHAAHAKICVSNMKLVPRSIRAARSSCNDPCRQNAVRVKIYVGSLQVVKDSCWQHVAYRKIHMSGTKTIQRFTSPFPAAFIDVCRQHAVCAKINIDSTRAMQKTMWAAYTVARAKFHVGNMKLHIGSM
jgi:hypothetical protein